MARAENDNPVTLQTIDVFRSKGAAEEDNFSKRRPDDGENDALTVTLAGKLLQLANASTSSSPKGRPVNEMNPTS